MADERESEQWLGELLDAAADGYEPDADRLKAMVTARIAQQSEEREAAVSTGGRDRRRAAGSRAEGPRRRGLGLLGRVGLAGIPAGVALATVGAAAALAVGATATIAVTSSHDHQTVSVAAPTTSPDTGGASSPSAPPSGGSPSAAATSRSASPSTSESGTPVSTSSSALVSVTASIGQASNPNWAELDVAVAIRQPLTALHVTVKVSKCPGLQTTDTWDTGASGQFTERTTDNADGSITYEFELVGGDQAGSGTVDFAVQFNHATTGWKPQDDTYYVSARTATSGSASSAGGAY
ncbi:MAG TPA: hypothetical protein VFN97_27255 [Actinospica sp.]|nr:hypothetical protein [Actinospica sp.]